MTVALCIASRGRPEELRKTIRAAHDAAELTSVISVALDGDDPETAKYNWSKYDWSLARISIEPREDSLGAKYNRAAREVGDDASLFVLGVDDAYPSSKGWDSKLLDAASQFEDGVGVVYFGKRKGPFDLPDSMAVTKGWIDQVGFFCPEHFPFWWHDTWIDEIARMTSRFVWADVSWEKHGSSEVEGHKTTRMRDVAFWAKFFDDTRPMRMEAAFGMLMGLDYPGWLRSQLVHDLSNTCRILRQRNSLVRDNAHLFERDYGAEQGADAGHDRLKARAEEMMRMGLLEELREAMERR